MKSGLPTFAVVGRSNKGKSSIVAALAENDSVLIAPAPRTTLLCQTFTFRVHEQELFQIIDTPGFEEAPAALEWLKSVPVSAHQRRTRVLEFLKEHRHGTQFRFECELLQPVMDGAAILYVADASRPYRPNYESEFEILQWTGQHAMALINMIGDGEFIDDWKAALSQYFRKVKLFDAHRSRIAERVDLLEDLKVIYEDHRPHLERALAAITSQHAQRLKTVAGIFSGFLIDALQFQERVPAVSGKETAAETQAIRAQYMQGLRDREKECRKNILAVFQFTDLEIHETLIEPSSDDEDLFSKRTWEIFGLSRSKLVAVGSSVGAIAGGGIDLIAGGASVLAGTGIGALIGGGSSLYLALSDPQLVGIQLKRSVYVVGPNRNPNFPWILLDRGLLFIEKLLHRTHAERSPLHVEHEGERKGQSSRLRPAELSALANIFRKARRKLAPDDLGEKLAAALLDLVKRADL